MSAGFGPKANLITGAVVIVGGLALVLWIGISAAIKSAGDEQTGRTFVAYFEDAGGIETGDAVRIKGRRAGIVTDVGLEPRDGKMMVRVEFEIRPGTGSPWLEKAGIPADSKIRIAEAGMFGRPQLNITIGESETEFIETGGEWTRTRGAASDNNLDQVADSVDRFKSVMDQLNEFLDDPEGMAAIRRSVGDLRVTLADADERVTSVFGGESKVAELIVKVREMVEDLDKSLRDNRESISKALDGLDESVLTGNDALDDLDMQLAEIGKDIREFTRLSSDLAGQLEGAGLSDLALELRKQSAKFRMGLYRSTFNPAEFGGNPSFHRSKRFFNNEHPLPGGPPPDNLEPPPIGE